MNKTIPICTYCVEAGNAVATPAIIAGADPSLVAIAKIATAQVAASCVISAILCPFIVSYAFKLMTKNKMKKLANGPAA
ncbi:hypothetical protein E4V42_15620 [Clostridium estertheticum]|uniref:2-keto-3-deoxygluconate permease n=1 Tax=Clostridium estertheticum TaxID=238834 RepID=A0A5N7IRB1_9CLOT|nr:hypothetical protein [Clostridium estertheticum]MPQ63518.1 hypothetical protein [Clostridium estertheticum]